MKSMKKRNETVSEKAYVIWLTGISGSGKTTLGKKIAAGIKRKYGKVEFIDGDEVRSFFEGDLGYSRNDRILNVRRIAFAAMLLAKNGTNVVVANIAPYYEVRDFIRRHIKNYIQIYLRSSLKEVMKRDIKGHYGKFHNGDMKNIIGLDDKYDVPRKPDLTVDTDTESVSLSLKKINVFFKNRKIL